MLLKESVKLENIDRGTGVRGPGPGVGHHPVGNLKGFGQVQRVPLAITFLDIDKFKDFNTTVGHTNVNRNVLPVFMATVEAQVYGHGCAYRMSGDEYALLMPNADSALALTFLKSLRSRVAALTYLGTEKTITLSAGLCIADRDCFLTDEELLQRSERAMAFAKDKGRNRIAGYTGKLFDDRELAILVE